MPDEEIHKITWRNTTRHFQYDPFKHLSKAQCYERGPVMREPHKGVFMLSRIDEILEVYTDHQRFSAIVGPLGPLVDVPQPAEGESLAEVIERRRHEIPARDLLTPVYAWFTEASRRAISSTPRRCWRSCPREDAVAHSGATRPPRWRR